MQHATRALALIGLLKDEVGRVQEVGGGERYFVERAPSAHEESFLPVDFPTNIRIFKKDCAAEVRWAGRCRRSYSLSSRNIAIANTSRVR